MRDGLKLKDNERHDWVPFFVQTNSFEEFWIWAIMERR